MMKALRQMAARIDADWKRADYKPRALPAISARVLTDSAPHSHYDFDTLANWILTTRRLPAPRDPFGPSGPPAFTVWANARFVINIYAYNTAEVVIHDHDFAGAFVNLGGTTIHCTYAFGDAERVDKDVLFGSIALKHVETITEGMVRAIEPGRGFIHQVWHIGQPTTVLVVRTPPLGRAAVRQFQYLRPHLATEVFRDTSLSVGYPDRFRYTRKLSECLRISPAGLEQLSRLIVNERPWDAVWHLLENWRYLAAHGALHDVLARGAKHHGAWFASLQPAGEKVATFYAIDWHHIVAAQERVVLALLLTYRSWPEIADTLKNLFPAIDPRDCVLESLERLSERRAIPLELNAERLAVLRCVLESELREKEWKQCVRGRFEMTGRQDWATVRHLLDELRRHELLMPLFEFTR